MAVQARSAPVSHNQIGQKLGRKGQETRERILSAMLRLVADQDGPPITLTNVAKEADVRLTNLYLYFPDLGDLLLAALDRVMDTAEAAYLDKLRQRWPDATLYESCLDFVQAHYDFWHRNARILHLRNAMADAGDIRVLKYRNNVSIPLIGLIMNQMDGDPDRGDGRDPNVATVLLTGLERVATVATNPQLRYIADNRDEADQRVHNRRLVEAEAEVLTLVIRHRRVRAERPTP